MMKDITQFIKSEHQTNKLSCQILFKWQSIFQMCIFQIYFIDDLSLHNSIFIYSKQTKTFASVLFTLSSSITVKPVIVESGIKHHKPTKPVYKGHSREPENVPFLYRLKLYALFINGKNETALYKQ